MAINVLNVLLLNIETAAGCVLLKKVFLEISQNSQKNTFFTEHVWGIVFVNAPFKNRALS